tara:strand:+ start:98662 stop:99369 length:708 start_codon:yes stop_codon:yes gene_type:complete
MLGLLDSAINKESRIFGLIGAGGFAREVMPLVVECFKKSLSSDGLPGIDHVFFVENEPKNSQVNGYPLISLDEFLAFDCKNRYFNIAIADSKVRQKIAIECIEKGAEPFSINASNFVAYDCNEFGKGMIMCAHTAVTSNVKIGDFFHANIYSYVAHDCVIGNYVTFAPNVHCNGNVHIHDHAYIGTGAVIKQGRTSSEPLVIGEGAVVGMGAVVTKDVPPHTTVVGNPAKVFTKV